MNLLELLRARVANRKLIDAVRASLAHDAAPGHVLAAVSGGSDSMALLALLRAALPARTTKVTAAYVDHGLRPAAAVEAAIVAGVCRRIGVDLVQAAVAPLRRPSEATLREARYAELHRLAKYVGAERIATGHTRDDQIETIVFRFLRGSSRAGLGGIPRRRGEIVRPLLAFGREELRTCLRSVGIGWIEDPSNADLRYARNRIRHSLIPAMEGAMGRGRIVHLPEVAEIWSAEDAYLESEAARFGAYTVRGSGRSAHLDLVAFDGVPAALRPRVLREWLKGCGAPSVPVVQLQRLAKLATTHAGSGRFCIGSVEIVREYDRLYASRETAAPSCPDLPLRIDTAGYYEGPDGEWRLEIEPRPLDEAPSGASIHHQVVDLPAQALHDPLRLRARRPGDAIRTLRHGRRKVHDIMIEARVPRSARASWPVLTASAAVIWVPGLAVAAEMESALTKRDAPRVRFAWHRRPL